MEGPLGGGEGRGGCAQCIAVLTCIDILSHKCC